jgi:hypothetical protein
MKNWIGMQGLMIVSCVTYWIHVKVPLVVCMRAYRFDQLVSLYFDGTS